MPEIYEVGDIEEAVELANKFKDDGTFDCIREPCVRPAVL